MGNAQFYEGIGVTIYWVLIKFCRTKLSEEMSEKKKV